MRNGRTAKTSSPETTGLQRPQRASAARPETGAPKADSSFNVSSEEEAQELLSYLLLLLLHFSFILIIILFLGGAFFYLWFNPKVPVFHLQSLKIQRFNVTVKSDATYIDSQTAVKVEVRNPNDKITFRYGKTSVTLTAGLGEDETELGSGSSGEFTQGKKSTTVVKWTVHEKNVLVADEVGAKLKARYRSRAMVVSVVVRTRVSLGVGGWRIGTVGMHISCGDVALKKLDGGDMPKCTVNVLKW